MKKFLAHKAARNRVPYVGHAIAGLLALLAFYQPQPAAAESNWQWEKTRTPMALVVKGIWWEFFKPEQSLDTVGIRMSEDFSDLSRYSVIVLINAAPGRVPNGDFEVIREFVQQGGGLVILGGLSAYGNSNYNGQAPLVDILPVDLKDSYIDFFPTAEKGAKLAKAAKADWDMPYDFPSTPLAYYFHTLIPTNGAKVEVTVGDQPAFVTGTYGKGRVVACALTVNGEPAAGQTPFWEWKDWPKLLGQACEWAAGARPVGTPIVKVQGSEIKPLTDDDVRSAEMELDGLPKDFVKRAMGTPNEKIAKLLFDLAVPVTGEPKCALEQVLPALLPYPQPAWVPRLKPLIEGSNPNIETRKAAMSLIGACRDQSAYGALVRALDDERTELAAMDGLGRLGNEKAISILKGKFAGAMRPAELPEGPDRFAAAAFVTASHPATYAAVALYRLGDPEGVNRLFNYARNLDLYHHIFSNASKRQARDPVGWAIVAALQADNEKLRQAWEYLENNVGPVPESQRAAFMKYAAIVDDPMMIEFLVSAMEKSAGKMSKTEWQSLATAKSGIIAKTSKALASE